MMRYSVFGNSGSYGHAPLDAVRSCLQQQYAPTTPLFPAMSQL
jgi:hypothetical protein